MMGGGAGLIFLSLSAGEAKKDFFQNEALQALALLPAAAGEEGPRSAPPATPAVGACFVVGSSPTGEWSGKNLCLAGYTSGGWRFIAPVEGMTAYVKTTGTWANYRSGAWEVGVLRGNSLVVGGHQVVGT